MTPAPGPPPSAPARHRVPALARSVFLKKLSRDELRGLRALAPDPRDVYRPSVGDVMLVHGADTVGWAWTDEDAEIFNCKLWETPISLDKYRAELDALREWDCLAHPVHPAHSVAQTLEPKTDAWAAAAAGAAQVGGLTHVVARVVRLRRLRSLRQPPPAPSTV